MANEATRKKIDEHTSFWQKTKTAFMPGDVSERTKALEQMADDNIEADKRAQAEAIRRKRMQTQGTGGA